ncbi:hypothetical protein JCM3765_005439 [Sporobolomyces pararoseus]
MYWKKYKREEVAQQLLKVSHRISDEAFVLRPIDDSLVRRFLLDIEIIGSELRELSYSQDCTTLELLSSVLSTLRNLESPPKGEGVRLSFMKALDLAQILIRAAQSLSTSSSPFPVPNRHPPPEILRLIYNYVAEEEDHAARQKTVTALALTSINWHQIVVERPIVYLPSVKALLAYFANPLLGIMFPRQLKPWEEIHLDLSGHKEDAYAVNKVLTELAYAERPKHQSKVIISMKGVELQDPADCENLRSELGDEWLRTSLRIREMKESDYTYLGMALHAGEVQTSEDKEYFIGHSEDPILLSTTVAQDLLEVEIKEYEALNVRMWEEEPPVPPIFTNYTVFAAPWIVFTAPIFLLETVPENYKPTSIPPSRLQHLELSFQIDPTDPPRAIRELESFFSKIAPRIERLAFRLHLAAPHPSSTAELNFTEHLVSSLLSCRRLQHLEIGGFGFSPDFLSRLTVLPLSTLSIRSLQYFKSYEQVVRLFETPSLLRQSLEEFSCPYFRKSRTRPLERMCKELNIWYGRYLNGEERKLYRELMNSAGLDAVSSSTRSLSLFSQSDTVYLLQQHLGYNLKLLSYVPIV